MAGKNEDPNVKIYKCPHVHAGTSLNNLYLVLLFSVPVL